MIPPRQEHQLAQRSPCPSLLHDWRFLKPKNHGRQRTRSVAPGYSSDYQAYLFLVLAPRPKSAPPFTTKTTNHHPGGLLDFANLRVLIKYCARDVTLLYLTSSRTSLAYLTTIALKSSLSSFAACFSNVQSSLSHLYPCRKYPSLFCIISRSSCFGVYPQHPGFSVSPSRLIISDTSYNLHVAYLPRYLTFIVIAAFVLC